MGMKLISNFRQVVAAVEKTLPKQVLRACHAVRNEWVKGLTGTRSGRRYRVPNTGQKGVPGTGTYYTASAPGEAPARRLGDAVRSIRVMPRIAPGRIQARVGSPLDHLVFLEYGTVKMEARPSLKPALDRARPAIDRIFSEGLI